MERLADPGPAPPLAGSWKYPPLLLRTPGDQPVPSPVPPGLRVERVGGVGGLRDWEQVAVDGFPYRELSRTGRELLDGVLDEERLRLWVGYEGDRPVCIGSLFVDAGVAGFSLGVTLPEARRGGYWAAMAGVRPGRRPRPLAGGGGVQRHEQTQRRGAGVPAHHPLHPSGTAPAHEGRRCYFLASSASISSQGLVGQQEAAGLQGGVPLQVPISRLTSGTTPKPIFWLPKGRSRRRGTRRRR